jgi:hypothetical protein
MFLFIWQYCKGELYYIDTTTDRIILLLNSLKISGSHTQMCLMNLEMWIQAALYVAIVTRTYQGSSWVCLLVSD